MIAAFARPLVIGFAFLLMVPTSGRAGAAEEKNVGQLKREVAERERQLVRAQRDLAEARARVALAEGNRETAALEMRKVVACCQQDVQWIRDHVNWFCDPRELMTAAQWDLAKTSASLAELQGDAASLVAARKKIVAFHEEQLERFLKLEQLAAVRPEEKLGAQEALHQAREQLAEAEKKLADEGAKKSNESK
jgi:hypothetical protein